MSAISELTEKVSELESRLVIMESALVKLIEKTNIQDLSGELVMVSDEDNFEMRNRIGYKTSKDK